MTAVSVVVVDDHPIVRQGLVGLLQRDVRLAVVAEAASGEEALAVIAARAARDESTDLVLMDLQLGKGISGIEATTRIRAAHPSVAVLVLTTFDADADVFGALQAGAGGYLLKDTPVDALVAAILDVASGRPALAPDVAGRVMARAAGNAETLSARETEILQLVADGSSNREIGRRLFISESTVKGHLVKAYATLGVDNRTAAVRVARERRLIR